MKTGGKKNILGLLLLALMSVKASVAFSEESRQDQSQPPITLQYDGFNFFLQQGSTTIPINSSSFTIERRYLPKLKALESKVKEQDVLGVIHVNHISYKVYNDGRILGPNGPTCGREVLAAANSADVQRRLAALGNDVTLVSKSNASSRPETFVHNYDEKKILIKNESDLDSTASQIKAAQGNSYALAINNDDVARATSIATSPNKIRLVPSSQTKPSLPGNVVADVPIHPEEETPSSISQSEIPSPDDAVPLEKKAVVPQPLRPLAVTALKSVTERTPTSTSHPLAKTPTSKKASSATQTPPSYISQVCLNINGKLVALQDEDAYSFPSPPASSNLSQLLLAPGSFSAPPSPFTNNHTESSSSHAEPRVQLGKHELSGPAYPVHHIQPFTQKIDAQPILLSII